jgi:cyanate permease
MFGLGVGNTTSLPSVIVQTEFPPPAFGQVVSTIIAINQFTYSFGPGLLGWLRDASGSYAAPLAGCLALQLAAVILVLCGRSPAVTCITGRDVGAGADRAPSASAP